MVGVLLWGRLPVVEPALGGVSGCLCVIIIPDMLTPLSLLSQVTSTVPSAPEPSFSTSLPVWLFS